MIESRSSPVVVFGQLGGTQRRNDGFDVLYLAKFEHQNMAQENHATFVVICRVRRQSVPAAMVAKSLSNSRNRRKFE